MQCEALRQRACRSGSGSQTTRVAVFAVAASISIEESWREDQLEGSSTEELKRSEECSGGSGAAAWARSRQQ